MKIEIPRHHNFFKEEMYWSDENEPPYILVCNRCKIQLPPSNTYEIYEQNLSHPMKAYFGYGSRHDMDRWSWDLCEDCLIEWVSSFAIEPQGFQGRGTFDDWKQEISEEKMMYRRFFSKAAFQELEQKDLRLTCFSPKETGLHMIYALTNTNQECISVETKINLCPEYKKEKVFVDLDFRATYEKKGIESPYYIWTEKEKEKWHLPIQKLLQGIQNKVKISIENDPHLRLKSMYNQVEVVINEMGIQMLQTKDEKKEP